MLGCGSGAAVWLAVAAAILPIGNSTEKCQGASCWKRVWAPYGTNYSVRYGKIPKDYYNVADADCVSKRRLQMRPYPGDCYGHDFDEPFGFIVEAWWNLFAEIGGDLQYTFDFILYDPILQSADVNQFWYLLAYLQRLARLVTDPRDVLSKKEARRTAAAGRRAGSQRASRLASKLRDELATLDALIAEVEGGVRRRAHRRPTPAKRSRRTKTHNL